MQIASIRGSLEKGITISSSMTEQMQSLEFWLQGTMIVLLQLINLCYKFIPLFKSCIIRRKRNSN